MPPKANHLHGEAAVALRRVTSAYCFLVAAFLIHAAEECVTGLYLVSPFFDLLAPTGLRPGTSETGRAAALPIDVAGFVLVPRNEQQEERFQHDLPRWIELLGTVDFAWREHRDAVGQVISLVALFHDTNWKSVHAPRICIEGSNMDIVVDDHVAANWLQPGASVSRIVGLSRADGRRYLTLSVFGTKTWLSGDYAEFSWHHMPLALLRQNESGFLLRAESMVGPDEELAAAEQRCARFLGALVPAAQGLLR